MQLDALDRIVVAKSFGIVKCEPAITATEAGDFVNKGEVLGHVSNGRDNHEIVAPCRACVIDFLVHDGDRVRPGDPLVHLLKL